MSFCFLLVSYTEFFGEDSDFKYFNDIKIRFVANDDTDSFISNCIFSNLTSSCAGAIFVDSKRGNIYIGNSVFEFCSSTGNFGGLLLKTLKSDIFIEKVCGFYCFTPPSTNINGQFGLISVESTRKTSVQLLSITKCSPFIGNSMVAFSISYGNQSYIHNNSSFNRVCRHSGTDFASSKDTQFRFSTISYNDATQWATMEIMSSYMNMSFSNIIGNNSPHSRGIFIINSASFVMKNCILLKNQNILFDIRTNNKFVTIMDSIIDILTRIESYPSTLNVMITNTQTLKILHLKNANCDAEFTQEMITRECHYYHNNMIVTATILLIIN